MPTLGKTSIGGTSGALSGNYECANGPYTATEDGTIESISLYASSVGGGSIRLGVWLNNGSNYPGTLVAETDSQTLTTGWMTFSATGSLVAGQSYYIGFLASNNVNNPYDAGSKEIVFRAKTFSNLSNPYPSGGTEVGSRDYTVYLTYNTTPLEEITIDSQVTRQLIQKNAGSETADIDIAGDAAGFTGDIEARFAGGAWQVIDTIIGNGAYSGTLIGQPLTLGTLHVRSKDEPGIEATLANVLTGRLYLVTGDSISEGRLVNAQSRNSVNASAYRQDDAWVWADDPTDTGTIGGSHWPLLAQHLTSHYGCPVGFITTATGSRDIAGGNSDYAKPNASGWGIITSQYAEAAVNGVEAFLVHLGPNAASGDTLSQAQYLAALTQWASDIRSDVQAGATIYLGVYGRSNSTGPGNPKIRRAIAEAISSGVFTCGPNLLGPNWADGVHPRTDEEAAITAGRWFAAITGTQAPRIRKAVLRLVATEVDLQFSGTLGGSNGDTYTENLFTVGGTTPISATRVSATRVRLVFASARSVGQAFVYVPAEEHIGATMPSSQTVSLPVTIHSVSSAVQPTDPVQLVVSREEAIMGANNSINSDMVYATNAQPLITRP